MIVGIVIAVGLGLTTIGGAGTMETSTEVYPDRKMVTLFIVLFLLGMAMVGGGLGAAY